MSNQTESRGWEIEDNYHEHFLDDPLIDLTEDFCEGNSRAFFSSAVVLVILIAGLFFLREWTKPPVLVFPVPVVQMKQAEGAQDKNPHQQFGPLTVEVGWVVDCLYADTARRLLRPNYHNAVCNEAAAKKRGEF